MQLKIKSILPNIIMWLSVIHFTTFSLWNKEVKAIIYLFLILGVYKFFVLNKKVIGIRLTLLFFLYFLYSCMNGLLFFDSTEQFFYGIYQYVFYTLMMFAYLYAFPIIDLKKISLYFTVIGVITSLVAIYEFASGTYLFYSADGDNVNLYFTAGESIYRSMAFSTSPLSLGPLLSIYALTNYHFFRIQKEKTYILLLLLNLVALMTTYSRGSWVSFIIGFVVYEVLRALIKNNFNNHSKNNLRKILKLFTVTLVIVIAGIVIFTLNINTDNAVMGNAVSRIQNIFDWQDDIGNLGRIYVWVQSFNIITDSIPNFFMGIGLASTGAAGIGKFSTMVTESGILKRFVEGGFIMMILYYSIIALIIIRGVKSLFYINSKYRNIVIYALSCLSIILVDDCTLQITEDISIAVFFWFFVALILYYSIEKNVEIREAVTKN